MTRLIELTRDGLVRALGLGCQVDARAARRDANRFVEAVLKDSRGLPVVQAEVHRLWQDHIDRCFAAGAFCGILAPWGHGKTEQAIVARALKLIGDDPDVRIKILCNTDDNATARVAAIGRYIIDDPDYHAVYPHVVPAPGRSWSRTALTVAHRSRAKDPTLEAHGIGAGGIGGRCDVLLVDDPVDLRNAVQQPAARRQVAESFRNVWLSRLEPGGRLIYIATRWHDADLTGELMANAAFKFLEMRIAEDFATIETNDPFGMIPKHIHHRGHREGTEYTEKTKSKNYCHSERSEESGTRAFSACNPDPSLALRMTEKKTLDDAEQCTWKNKEESVYERPAAQGHTYRIPLWRAHWDEAALRKRCEQIGRRAFDRGFRQQPLSDDEMLFQRAHIEAAYDYTLTSRDLAPNDWITYAGVDLAGTDRPGNVIFVLGVAPDGTRVPLEIQAGGWTSPETARRIVEMNRRWRPQIIAVENNAYQQSLLDWMSLLDVRDVPVRPFTTGAAKSHLAIGLPSLAVEFERGAWRIPMGLRHHEESCDCATCAWIQEMLTYPLGRSSDRLMACWFAREAARAAATGTINFCKLPDVF